MSSAKIGRQVLLEGALKGAVHSAPVALGAYVVTAATTSQIIISFMTGFTGASMAKLGVASSIFGDKFLIEKPIHVHTHDADLAIANVSLIAAACHPSMRAVPLVSGYIVKIAPKSAAGDVAELMCGEWKTFGSAVVGAVVAGPLGAIAGGAVARAATDFWNWYYHDKLD